MRNIITVLLFFILLSLNILLFSLNIIDSSKMDKDKISPNEENTQLFEEMSQPIMVAMFPMSTNEESYIINLSTNGHMETIMGERKDGIVECKDEMDDVDFDNIMEEGFCEIVKRAEKDLSEEEIEKINGLINNINFQEIQTKRLFFLDGWEEILWINNKSYYLYYNENEDEDLRKLVEELKSLSPVIIDIHGWT